jgi:glycosyltransferase involved in cell wall biosynthesis
LPFNVSLVLTLHREGKYLLRTLLSLKEAVLFARTLGISTELVAVLDRADQVTTDILKTFDLAAFDGHRILHVDNGSLGLSRNDGILVAGGKYICMCAGEDLISYNYIAAMFLDGERKGPFTAFFPHYLVIFGEAFNVQEYLSLGEITPFALLHMHPFVSCIFARHELFAAQKYLDVRLSSGYAYDDWHFNCEITARGYSLDVTQDTILFYRQRHGGLLAQVDRVPVQQIPPSQLFRPSNFLKYSRAAYEKLKDVDDLHANLRTLGPDVFQDPVCLEFIAATNRIEPAIDSRLFVNRITHAITTGLNANIGKVYYKICELIGDKVFDDVFILPFFAGGGAELYALKIMHELVSQNLATNILLIFGEKISHHIWLDKLPTSVVVVDLASMATSIDIETQDMLTLKIIQSCAAGARIHIRHSLCGERFFKKFRAMLRNNHCIYYRFGNIIYHEGEYQMMGAGGFDFVSENLDYFHSIVADNESIIISDQMRLGVQGEKWQCLKVPHSPKVDREVVATKALGASHRVLWASRIAFEKRPKLIPEIARNLLHEQPNISIHAFGTDSFGQFDPEDFRDLPNLCYEGPFSDFEMIAANDYTCFIYTSLFDGMPNVVLEAISMGLPVIAPDVGAISEIVIDNETGILLPSLNDDKAMAELYAKAIIRLVNSQDLRTDIVDKAFERLREYHSLDMFARRVSEIFGPKTKSALTATGHHQKAIPNASECP